MFDKEFYPTPRHVLDRMCIDCDGKIVLEPSAGKGDIIDYVKEYGARDVLACELNSDLRKIVSYKASVIAEDFLQVREDQVSHIDLIIMNPPFSKASKHILHAWKIAPDGCEIIGLCNWETVRSSNYGGYSRTELASLVANYGSAENLEDCFSAAERRTDVEVGLVKLFKPVNSESSKFEGFHLSDDDHSDKDGIVRYSEVRAVVNSYVAAVKCFERFEQVASDMNRFTSVTNFGSSFGFQVNYNEGNVTTKEEFARKLQKHCWKHIFHELQVDKYVTSGVMKDVNAFVESRINYPFTIRNVYKMVETIVGTQEHTMNRAIVEAVDNFTRHTHENRYGVEGWKTNEGHLLNFKFISGWISESDWHGRLKIKTWNGNFEKVLDLTKAICYITGTSFDTISDIRSVNGGSLNANEWYDWGFFQFKVFKKGSGHFKFKGRSVWEVLNRRYAKAKGQVLPEKI